MGHTSATCVIGYSRGFFVSSNEGVLACWEKRTVDAEIPYYEFIRSWSSGRNQQVCSMAISPGEQTLAFSLRNNNIGTCNISVNLAEVKEVPVDIICKGFHKGMITGMDIAIQRPLLVTCSSSDASLRVWNYLTFRCEVAKILTFNKEATGLQ